LSTRIQQSTQQKEALAKKARDDEEARKRQEILSTLRDGEFDDRVLLLSETLLIPPSTESYAEWLLFSGRRSAIWTEYTAEPKEQFVKTGLPVMSVQVVDFASNVYSTTKGFEVDRLIAEVTHTILSRSGERRRGEVQKDTKGC
jgi:hypothetical protein